MKKYKRYVAELDLPEGYISIDFDVEVGDENCISFFLNQSSVNSKIYLVENYSVFKYRLFNNFNQEIFTKRHDVGEFIIEILKREFGKNQDILVKNIDQD